jgi:hypothetical protein
LIAQNSLESNLQPYTVKYTIILLEAVKKANKRHYRKKPGTGHEPTPPEEDAGHEKKSSFLLL